MDSLRQEIGKLQLKKKKAIYTIAAMDSAQE
jgi:hypothetical protein